MDVDVHREVSHGEIEGAVVNDSVVSISTLGVSVDIVKTYKWKKAMSRILMRDLWALFWRRSANSASDRRVPFSRSGATSAIVVMSDIVD